MPNPLANAVSNTGAVRRAGIHLALLQLLFALGWTIYVIYLPKLAAEVGIAGATVILILMLDQAIFTVSDTAMGIASDKVSRLVGQLGRFVAGFAAISCAAFVALPYVAGTGPASQIYFIALIVIWAATSSVLRAPPLKLLGKYGARPQLPMLSAMVMLGYGVAGAVSPYIGVALRGVDARLPFVISSCVLLLTALALTRVEQSLASAPPPAMAAPDVQARAPAQMPAIFVGAMVILALGYQLHFSINTAPYFLRFAKPADLEWLLPVFWIGFNLALFPASYVTKRLGGLWVMGAAGFVGGLAVLAADFASNLQILIATQFIAGACWGCVMMSATASALAIGETRKTGQLMGLVFSALALATFARMAVVFWGWHREPDFASLLRIAPVLCWTVAGAGLLVLAMRWLRSIPVRVASGS